MKYIFLIGSLLFTYTYSIAMDDDLSVEQDLTTILTEFLNQSSYSPFPTQIMSPPDDDMERPSVAPETGIMQLKCKIQEVASSKKELFKGFLCFECDSCFNTLEELENHMETDPAQKFHRIQLKRKTHQAALVKKIINSNPRSTLTKNKNCYHNQCEYSCKTYKELENHIARNHPSPTKQLLFNCNECLKPYTTKSSLNLHKQRIHGEKIYFCTEPGCLQSFAVKGDLTQHIKRTGHPSLE